MPKCSTRPYGSPRPLVRGPLRRDERLRRLDRREVRLGEVGRAAPQLGQHLGERVDDRAGCGAGRHFLARLERPAARPRRRRAVRPPRDGRTAPCARGSPRPTRRSAPATPRATPRRARAGRGCARARRRRPTKDCSGSKPRTFLVAASSSPPRAEPWILPVFCLPGDGPADDRAEDDQRRLVGLALGRLDRGVQLGDVLDVLAGLLPVHDLHVPAVGLVARRDVLGEGDVRVVLDRDLVGVVDRDQVAERLVTGERGCLAGDALLQVAVTGDHVHEVVERRRAGRQPRGRTGRARSGRRTRSPPRRRGPGRADRS